MDTCYCTKPQYVEQRRQQLTAAYTYSTVKVEAAVTYQRQIHSADFKKKKFHFIISGTETV
jgi:hypothetical protein